MDEMYSIQKSAVYIFLGNDDTVVITLTVYDTNSIDEFKQTEFESLSDGMPTFIVNVLTSEYSISTVDINHISIAYHFISLTINASILFDTGLYVHTHTLQSEV